MDMARRNTLGMRLIDFEEPNRRQDGRSRCKELQLEKPHALVCTEVWGGNRRVTRAIKLPSLAAWVASVSIQEGEGGGDLHYMSVCDFDLVSRAALADVSGHGRDVNAVTQTQRSLMRKNINAWNQSDFMRGLNDTFRQSGNDEYATAIVLSFHRSRADWRSVTRDICLRSGTTLRKASGTGSRRE
jgi:hypothetical protein